MKTSAALGEDVTQWPQRFKWTRLQFERAHNLGLWSPEERLELVRGDVYKKEAKTPAHATVFMLLHSALLSIFGAGFVIGQQFPFVINDESLPEPDTAVVVGTARDFLYEHPSRAILLVEISNLTLDFDLGIKASLYAQTNVEDYWAVDIRHRIVHVHRAPIVSASPNGYGFGIISRLTDTDSVCPLAAPDHPIRVVDIFP